MSSFQPPSEFRVPVGQFWTVSEHLLSKLQKTLHPLEGDGFLSFSPARGFILCHWLASPIWIFEFRESVRIHRLP